MMPPVSRQATVYMKNLQVGAEQYQVIKQGDGRKIDAKHRAHEPLQPGIQGGWLPYPSRSCWNASLPYIDFQQTIQLAAGRH